MCACERASLWKRVTKHMAHRRVWSRAVLQLSGCMAPAGKCGCLQQQEPSEQVVSCSRSQTIVPCIMTWYPCRYGASWAWPLTAVCHGVTSVFLLEPTVWIRGLAATQWPPTSLQHTRKQLWRLQQRRLVQQTVQAAMAHAIRMGRAVAVWRSHKMLQQQCSTTTRTARTTGPMNPAASATSSELHSCQLVGQSTQYILSTKSALVPPACMSYSWVTRYVRLADSKLP